MIFYRIAIGELIIVRVLRQRMDHAAHLLDAPRNPLDGQRVSP